MRRQPVGGRGERRAETAQPIGGWDAAQLVENERQRESDRRDREPPRLAAIRPNRANDQAGARGRADALEVAHEIAVARRGVACGEVEPAQPRLDRGAVGAREGVEARSRGLVEERLGEPCALGFDFVARRALGFQPFADFVVAIRGGRRGALRIGPRVGGFVGERGVTDAAPIAFQRREGGRRDRDGGIAANACRVDRHDHHAGQIRRPGRLAGGGGQVLDRFDEATKRETLARAGRADNSRQERGLRLRHDAELGKRLDGLGGVAKIRAIGGIGIENRIVRGALNDVGGDDRRRGTSAFARRRPLAGNAPYTIVRADFDQASLRPLSAAPAATTGVVRAASRGDDWPRRRSASSAKPLGRRRSVVQPQGAALPRAAGTASRRACAALACFGNFSAMP